MDCREAAPRIALAALDALDGDDAVAMASHVAACERCAEELRSLRQTRGALAAATVATAPPLDVDAVMAAGTEPRAAPAVPRLVSPSRLALRRVAAAAAWLGVAALSGWLGGAARPGAPAASDALVSGPTVETLARGLLLLDDRLTSLETNHSRDLLLLAQSIDRAQERRDRGVAEQLETLALETGRELAAARHAVFTISRQLPAVRSADWTQTRDQ